MNQINNNKVNSTNNHSSKATPTSSGSTDIDAANNMLKEAGFPVNGVNDKPNDLSALDVAIDKSCGNDVIKGLIELGFNMSQVVNKKAVGVALAEKGFSKEASEIASILVKDGFSKEASDIASELIKKSANTNSQSERLPAHYAKEIAESFVQNNLPDGAYSIANQLIDTGFSNLPQIIAEDLGKAKHNDQVTKIAGKLIGKNRVSNAVDLAVNIDDPELLKKIARVIITKKVSIDEPRYLLNNAMRLVELGKKNNYLSSNSNDHLLYITTILAKNNQFDCAKLIVDSLFDKGFYRDASYIAIKNISPSLSSYIVDKLIHSDQYTIAQDVALSNRMENLQLSCDIAIKLVENNREGALIIFDHIQNNTFIQDQASEPKFDFLEQIASKLVEFNHINDAYSTYKKLNNVNYAYAKNTAKTIRDKIIYKVLNNVFGWLIPSFFTNNQESTPPTAPTEPDNRI